MERPHLLHWEIITKLQKYIHEIIKSSPPELLGQFYNICNHNLYDTPTVSAHYVLTYMFWGFPTYHSLLIYVSLRKYRLLFEYEGQSKCWLTVVLLANNWSLVHNVGPMLLYKNWKTTPFLFFWRQNEGLTLGRHEELVEQHRANVGPKLIIAYKYGLILLYLNNIEPMLSQH